MRVLLSMGIWVLVGVLCSATETQAQETITVKVNFVVLDDGITELALNATFEGPDDVVGEVDPILPDLFNFNILIIANQIFGQCNVAFELGAVKVLKVGQTDHPLGRGNMQDVAFTGQGRELFVERASSVNALSELSLLTAVQPGQPDFLELDRSGPYLTMFVVGADIGTDGVRDALALGQLDARHSIATYRNFLEINDRVGSETIAHEWGHNFGLLHTDNDGFPETDDVMRNLMCPCTSPNGGQVQLVPNQCNVVRTSPLLGHRPQAELSQINVPQDFSSIQAAIDAAPPGATITVGAGVYSERLFIDKPMQLVAQANAEVTLRDFPETSRRGLSGGIEIKSASGVTVQGFVLEGQGIAVSAGLDVVLRANVITGSEVGVDVFNARLRIEENTLTANSTGVSMVSSAGSRLRANTFSGNDFGIFFSRVVDTTVQANTITAQRGEYGRGLEMSNSSGIVIAQNTVSDNVVGVLLFNSDAELVENTFADNQDFGIFVDENSQITACSANTARNSAVSNRVPQSCFG